MIFPYYDTLKSNSIHPFSEIEPCVLEFHYFAKANESTLYIGCRVNFVVFYMKRFISYFTDK